MHAELLQMAADLARREEPFVLAVVVRRRPASSAQAGDMAVVTAGGEFHGWLGGSCIQPTVVREARQAMADGRARLVALSPDPAAEQRPGVVVFPMTCHSGGSVEIYIEPVLPPLRLVIFGASPTARALLTLGKAMGYSVVARKAPPEAAEAADGAEAGKGAEAAGRAAAAASALGTSPSPAPCWVVVATMGEGDEEAIEAALALAPAYLGVVASARRFAQLRDNLLGRGVAAAALDSIRSPAGIAIGAHTPEEIALSVLAEIVERRRRGAEAGRATQPAEPPKPSPRPPAATAALAAVDPVCGMTVEPGTARYVADLGGRRHYFCSASCRERFLAAPERFASRAGAGGAT